MPPRAVSIVPRKNNPAGAVQWKRLVLLMFVFSGALWLAATWGVWLFIKYQRRFPDVRYTDLLLPGRWAHYRTSEGNYLIAQGEIFLRQNDPAAALHWLRTGISKAPANAKGRTLLARLYQEHHRPDLAGKLLLDGLHQLAGDPVYVQTALSFLLEFQEDAQLLDVSSRLLALTGTAGAACRPVAATYAATAAYLHGNFDQAESLIHQYQLSDSVDGAMLLARMDWECGYPELALLRLNAFLSQHPDYDKARALLAGYYRFLGRNTEWKSAIIERLVHDPLAAAPRVEYLYFHHQRRDRAQLERETESYLNQFQHDGAALLLLADFAANTGRPALARRVQQIFSDRADPGGAVVLLVVEAHIAAGEYQAAHDLITDCRRQHPEWTGPFSPVFHGLRAVALCGLGKKDEARLSLDLLLSEKNLRADHLVAVSNRLSVLGARDLSLAVLNRAVEADPRHQAALAPLLRLELDTGQLAPVPDQLIRFMHTRRPSREILARAYETFGSDRHLFLPRQRELLASLRTALASSRL